MYNLYINFNLMVFQIIYKLHMNREIYTIPIILLDSRSAVHIVTVLRIFENIRFFLYIPMLRSN